jgi:hypothetical protein
MNYRRIEFGIVEFGGIDQRTDFYRGDETRFAAGTSRVRIHFCEA